jgi:asparagine synthase (glutamine-hydrolysing)
MLRTVCGIAGSTIDPAGSRATAMAAAMVHRGPDDEGVYVDPDCAFSMAARRLSIIDVAGGHQPTGNEDGSVWAVLNGEIYNHAPLRDRLRRRGHSFASQTDTEVLVHLYEEYGESLVHAVEGMYAFAIWDRKGRKLTLARDRFGEKPLFYAESADELVFASELTALRVGLSSKPELDPDSLDAFFVLGYLPGERTVFQGLRQLPPATMLRWSPTSPRAKLSTYWSMPRPPCRRRESVSELADEGAPLLREAVRSRLAADVPVGVFLSGGLDSTLIASIAAEEVTGRLSTFTVVYDIGDVDEAVQARAAARRLGTEHHEVVLSLTDVAARVPRVIGSLDQPNADPALVALHAVAETARLDVTVAVGGEGADELFGGYPRYRWIRRAELMGRYFPAPIARAGAGLIRRSLDNRAGRLADVLKPATPAERNLDWVTAGRRHVRAELYGPRLRERASSDCALEDAAAVLKANGALDPSAQSMALDQRRYLPDDVLAKADRATMQVSLEMRTPYLSRELAEFSATIPPSVHLANGGKAVLREIAGRLPVISGTGRAKRAFQVPMSQWLRGPLAPLLEHQLAGGCLIAEGWIDPRALGKTIDAHLRGSVDQSALLWPVLVAGLWLDRLHEG